MIRPEMMLSAATSTISIRMRNITLRSTSSTPKKVLLRCRQSDSMIGRSIASSIACAHGVDAVGMVDEDLDGVASPFLLK